MTTVKEARENALSFLSEQGLKREFIENVALKLDDAEKLIDISRQKNPQKILEIGTFVGVSTAVLGLCLPETQVVCVDADLPVELQNLLCVQQFDLEDRQTLENQRTNLYFVEKVLKHFGVFENFTLNSGFFSCCFPNPEDLDKVVNYRSELKEKDIIGREVCEEYGPFDIAFLDGDHRTEAVKQDLTLLSRYMRPGGTIVLHDVGLDSWGQQVRQGVEEFWKEHPQKEFSIEGEIGFISI